MVFTVWPNVVALGAVLVLSLQGCADGGSYDINTTVAFFFAVLISLPCCCILCLWGYGVLYAWREGVSIKSDCCTLRNPSCIICGVSAFLGILVWIVWSIYAANRNCQTLQSLQPEFCQVWREPFPSGFSGCCVDVTENILSNATTSPCPGTFFGEACDKERVQARNISCSASNSAVCKGLVIAAVPEDRSFCSKWGHDCTPWTEVRDGLSTIYGVELGDIIVDGLALLLLLFIAALINLMFANASKVSSDRREYPSSDGVLGKRGKDFKKFVAFVTSVTFAIDLSLQLVLVATVGGAVGGLGQVKEASCVSEGGDFYLTFLQDTASTIATIAWCNIVFALIGSGCDLYSVVASVCDCIDPLIELLALAGALMAVFCELVLGLVNFLQIQAFARGIASIEHAALGVKDLQSGHVCFVRHSDLPRAVAAGVELTPFLSVILPSLILFGSFLGALSIRCCYP